MNDIFRHFPIDRAFCWWIRVLLVEADISMAPKKECGRSTRLRQTLSQNLPFKMPVLLCTLKLYACVNVNWKKKLNEQSWRVTLSSHGLIRCAELERAKSSYREWYSAQRALRSIHPKVMRYEEYVYARAGGNAQAQEQKQICTTIGTPVQHVLYCAEQGLLFAQHKRLRKL